MPMLKGVGRKVKVIVDVEELARAGGYARGKKLSAQELSQAGKSAVNARWESYYREHPEKLKARQDREKKKGTVPRGRPKKQATKRKAKTQC